MDFTELCEEVNVLPEGSKETILLESDSVGDSIDAIDSGSIDEGD